MRRVTPLVVPAPIMAAVASAILILAVLTLLSACAPNTPTVDIQTVCPPIATYSQADQDNIRAAYDILPAQSVLRRTIMDYLALRDVVRACQAKPSTP